MSSVIGDRGESIFEIAITEYRDFPKPLFKPAFLGEKWPAVDYFVELQVDKANAPYFLVQVKATASPLGPKSRVLKINAEKEKCERLFAVPGPTYVVGIHEPTGKAYIRSVHLAPTGGSYSIPLKNELNSDNMRKLYDEVIAFWQSRARKPLESHFG